MTIFLLIVMVLLLTAALERANRRQLPHPPRLHGGDDDRDWAHSKLELLALAGQAEPFAHKPLAVKRHGQTDTPGLQHTPKPARQP
jgi:hypothetical protein